MLPKHIALVSLSNQLTPAELSQTSAALQKQATRDLGPIWNINATIDYFPDLKSIPQGYWPIIITENIKEPGAAGFHTDKNHQPFSLVELNDSWQLTCSHEMCEMLVDPYGNKLVSAGSKDLNLGKVNFLVEVCDPCEDASFAYSINGILVSDFYTPNYFDPQMVPGVRYSYTGSLSKPCEIKKNGYLSWQDPISKKWYQASFFGSSVLVKPVNGMKEFGSSLRGQMDRLTKNPNAMKSFQLAERSHAQLKTKIKKAAESGSNDWTEVVSEFVKPNQTISKKKLTEALVSAHANVAVTFFSGGIADKLTATLDRTDGTQDIRVVGFNGGIMSFDNASSNDMITIDGLCLGHAVVKIDVPLNNDPQPSYPAGNILDFFTVK